MDNNLFENALGEAKVETIDDTASVDDSNLESYEDQSTTPSHGYKDLSIHSFYHYALQLLAGTLRSVNCFECDQQRIHSSLKQNLGLLYMWAQGLDLNYLQNGVDHDTGLQKTVVRDLTGIVITTMTFANYSKFEQAQIEGQVMAFGDRYINISADTDDESDDSSSTSSHLNTNSDERLVIGQEDIHTNHIKASSRLNMHMRSLMDLSPTIVHSCREERFRSKRSISKESISDVPIDQATQPYIMQIRDKFPSIDMSLAEKLGKANRTRSQRLLALNQLIWRRKYVVENDEDYFLEDDSQEAGDDTAMAFQPVSEFQDSGLGASLPAKSRYSSSVASHSSFMSTASAVNRGAVRVPPTPAQVNEGLPFGCTICGLLQLSIRNRIDWKLHVFADLQAYICTFEDCTHASFTFTTRKQWAEHEFEKHRRQPVWRCYWCKSNLNTEYEFINHLKSEHSAQLPSTENGITSIVQNASTSIVVIDNQACPLCTKVGFKDQLDWSTHVGRHLEEIALIALPRDADSDDEDENSRSSSDQELKSKDGEKQVNQYDWEVWDNLVRDMDSSDQHEVAPTLQGFVKLVHGLNPRIHPYLLQRVANDRFVSYQKLLQQKVQHLQHIQLYGECPSGALCSEFVGRNGQLRSEGKSDHIGNLDPESAAIQESEVPTEVVNPEMFPPSIPLPPVTHFPAEFECPLCFNIKKILKHSDWTKHVHEDTQAYSCTFMECIEPKKFKRFADWVRHENERHRHLEYWQCCRQDCTSSHLFYRKDNFVQHLIRDHKYPSPKSKSKLGSSTEDQNFWNIVDSSHRKSDRTPQDEPCKFCGNISLTWDKLSAHMGRHQNEISRPIFKLLQKDASFKLSRSN